MGASLGENTTDIYCSYAKFNDFPYIITFQLGVCLLFISRAIQYFVQFYCFLDIWIGDLSSYSLHYLRGPVPKDLLLSPTHVTAHG